MPSKEIGAEKSHHHHEGRLDSKRCGARGLSIAKLNSGVRLAPRRDRDFEYHVADLTIIEAARALSHRAVADGGLVAVCYLSFTGQRIRFGLRLFASRLGSTRQG
jgi:hypothetical protein